MNLLLLNVTRFTNAFRAFGHDVTTAGCRSQHDLQFTPETLTLPAILKQMPSPPDAIIVELWADNPFVLGLETAECPVVGYVIDSTLNNYWLRDYGRIVDRLLVDHRPDEELYRAHGIDAHWLPLSVDQDLLPPLPASRDYEHDVVFVGHFQPHRRKRRLLVDHLAKHLRVHVAGGDGDDWLPPEEMYTLFSRSRIILNENLFHGWTQRIVEGAGCGSLLLSERVSPDTGNLLTEDRDLVFFQPDSLVDKARQYLELPASREQIAEQGRRTVLDHHTHMHRARAILNHIREVDVGQRLQQPAALLRAYAAKAWRLCMLRWPMTMPVLWEPTQEAANEALQQQLLTDEMLLLLGRMAGQWTDDAANTLALLREAFQTNPDNLEARLALAEAHHRNGDRDAARILYTPLLPDAPSSRSDASWWRLLGDTLTQRGRSYLKGYMSADEDLFPTTALPCYLRAARLGDTDARWRVYELTAELGDVATAYEQGLLLAQSLKPHPTRLRQLAIWAEQAYRFEEARELHRVAERAAKA